METEAERHYRERAERAEAEVARLTIELCDVRREAAATVAQMSGTITGLRTRLRLGLGPEREER